jgi:hypothetical protein
VLLAASLALASTGKSKAPSTAMIVITTSNSISAKQQRALALTIRAIRPLSGVPQRISPENFHRTFQAIVRLFIGRAFM